MVEKVVMMNIDWNNPEKDLKETILTKVIQNWAVMPIAIEIREASTCLYAEVICAFGARFEVQGSCGQAVIRSVASEDALAFDWRGI